MTVTGFKFSGISAGIKKNEKKDIALIYSDLPLSAAGVFTSSTVKAAPVVLDVERIKGGIARAIIVNSGNANACTGRKGLKDAKETARRLAEEFGLDEKEVLVSSTGVIGERLPMDKISEAIPRLSAALSENGILDFAEAIMTTDAFPKVHFVRASIEGKEVIVCGVAKGAGMIAPNMATMLAYLMTDASVAPDLLQQILRDLTDTSFNCITVDGDMSTNDTVIALASGASGIRIDGKTPGCEAFISMMKEVMVSLAKMIVKDGEGATKLIEITVKGAKTKEEAKKAGLKIANSPLVKTAFFGEDPNWGRIVAALGASGIQFDDGGFDIYLGDVCLVKNGCFNGKDAERAAAGAMKGDEIRLTLNLNRGDREATLWTCDLTHDYIRINADYRT